MATIQQHGARRDLSAYETRTRLRVTVRPTNQVIVGHLVPRGTHEIEVPASCVDDVRALVETAEHRQMLKLAEQSYQRELEKHIKKGHSESTLGRNVPGEFRKIAGCSIPPLTACEVLAENIAPPLTEADVRANGNTTALLAALTKAGVIRSDDEPRQDKRK